MSTNKAEPSPLPDKSNLAAIESYQKEPVNFLLSHILKLPEDQRKSLLDELNQRYNPLPDNWNEFIKKEAKQRSDAFAEAFTLMSGDERDWAIRESVRRSCISMAETVLAQAEQLRGRNLSDLKQLPDELRIFALEEMVSNLEEQSEEKTSVLNKLLPELERLKDWKESAISVMPDLQAIGKALNVPLGQSIHDKILPGIEALKRRVNDIESALGQLVHLKAYKEAYGKTPEYEQEQPKAWEVARQLMSSVDVAHGSVARDDDSSNGADYQNKINSLEQELKSKDERIKELEEQVADLKAAMIRGDDLNRNLNFIEEQPTK
jgi:hypothetical protein